LHYFFSFNKASENGGSEGYGTGRGTPEDPSFIEESTASNKSDRSESLNMHYWSLILFSLNQNFYK
jgi:hypothetical protein